MRLKNSTQDDVTCTIHLRYSIRHAIALGKKFIPAAVVVQEKYDDDTLADAIKVVFYGYYADVILFETKTHLFHTNVYLLYVKS